MSIKAKTSTRIITVDDHPIVRFGVETALSQIPGFEVVGHASTVEEAFPLVESTQPDLLILDLLLDGKMSPDYIPQLKALRPEMRILVFTMSDESIFGPKALQAGASGYLMKSDGLTELQNAAQKVLAGEIYLSNRLNLLRHKSAAKNQEILPRLSRREQEIFHRLGKGMTTSEIARELNVSVKTVATHRDNLKLKLNAATSIELVQKAVSCAFGQMK